jgi:DNA-binding IclR family transcriptional regulator
MARPSPGVERAIAVLDFLAAHPGEAFTLSELARRLDLNKATAHALLNSLTTAGYLLRHPARMTYTLGPALIALGAAAQHQFEAADFAREEMRSLSDELGLECLATTAVGDDMLIVARAGAPRALGTVQPGQRLPLTPPLGSVFMAFATAPEIEQWLSRAPEDERPQYRDGLEAVRRRGYAVGLEADPRATLGRALADLTEDAPARRLVEQLLDELGHQEYILTSVDRQARYLVNHLVAPVFGPAGDVVLALSLYGFTGAMTGRQLETYGDRLLEATGNVTKSIHGREPDVA